MAMVCSFDSARDWATQLHHRRARPNIRSTPAGAMRGNPGLPRRAANPYSAQRSRRSCPDADRGPAPRGSGDVHADHRRRRRASGRSGRDRAREALLAADGQLTLVARRRERPVRVPRRQRAVRDPGAGAGPRAAARGRRRHAHVEPSLQAIASTSVGRGLHELAEQSGADLLVVGSSRRGLAGRALLGDDTHAALNGGACAVAVAPTGYGSSAAVIREIGVGYDASPESERALELARELAGELGARLSAFQADVRTRVRARRRSGPDRGLDRRRRRRGPRADRDARAGSSPTRPTGRPPRSSPCSAPRSICSSSAHADTDRSGASSTAACRYDWPGAPAPRCSSCLARLATNRLRVNRGRTAGSAPG